MAFWQRKKQQKESNIARTPEESSNPKRIMTKQKVFFLIWNILSITLYSSYTLFVIYKMSEKNFLSKVIVYLLAAYAIAFILLILISIGNQTKLKFRLKNFKSATSFLKYLIQIINFVLSIVTAISAFFATGKADLLGIIYGILSLAVTFFLILIEIAKIIIRKNIPLIKRNFLEIREKPEPQKKEKDN